MKLSKKQLQELTAKIVRSYIIEAEEKKDDAEVGNPFAAAAEGGEEGGEEAPAEEGGGEEGDKKEAKPEKPAGIPIKFNTSKVKQYNKANFLSDMGVVKSIDKKGIVVTTQPDGVDVLVNFSDISENVKRFFKNKK